MERGVLKQDFAGKQYQIFIPIIPSMCFPQNCSPDNFVSFVSSDGLCIIRAFFVIMLFVWSRSASSFTESMNIFFVFYGFSSSALRAKDTFDFVSQCPVYFPQFTKIKHYSSTPTNLKNFIPVGIIIFFAHPPLHRIERVPHHSST